MNDASLPPIERSISVSWDPAYAFRRFTSEFGAWWPMKTHSVGGPRVRQIVFETRVGGLISEEHSDGRRFQWGEVLEWEPPRRVKFTWHPSREPEAAQEVEVRFVPEGGGTRVELISSRGERWGERAARARKGYGIGWSYVLNVWAGRRTGSMRVLDAIAGVLKVVEWLRGGTRAAIARARGEIVAPRELRRGS